jgi:hypothetical protein
MRETRLSGSEGGGVGTTDAPYPYLLLPTARPVPAVAQDGRVTPRITSHRR